MPRKCVFCGGPANSREDVFPLWLNQVIPGAGTLTHTRSDGASWEGSGFDVKVRQVCRKTCNNGWMSRLEQATKPLLTPMLRGERTWPLAAREQVRLGFWSYKTAIMMALTTSIEKRTVPADHYEFVYRAEKPPDGVHIWIAEAEVASSEGLTVGWGEPEFLHFETGSGSVDAYGYRLSFSVVTLVFQVVYDPTGARWERPRPLRDVWTRIRPISKGAWPPGRRMTLADLKSLGEGRILPRP